MGWATPQFSKKQVNAAGKVLIDPDASVFDQSKALQVINNWRASHNFPLNTFQIYLRKKVREVHPDGVVAQRIKRLASIELKLSRFPTMTLSQMQDIGGCRAVLKNVAQVRELREIYRSSRIKHELHTDDDYIENPKQSGYRGVHLIYRYYSDRSEAYNSLKIEMQLRSQYQHAWATAVETVGTFVQQALKSSIGTDEWLRFFELMGGEIAYREGTAAVPGTPSNREELRRELRRVERELDVSRRLPLYGAALRHVEAGNTRDNSYYYLLELDPDEPSLFITGYPKSHSELANAAYTEIERAIASRDSRGDAVLVSADGIAQLRRAYPNYFADTRVFVGLLQDALKPPKIRPRRRL